MYVNVSSSNWQLILDNSKNLNKSILLFFFLSFIYLSNLYTQCRTGYHDPEIKSRILFQLSQPGAPPFSFFMENDLGLFF